MNRLARRHRHVLRTTIALGALTVAPLLGACSSTDDASPPTSGVPGTTGTAPGTTVTISDEERLAEAKTVAVGFFEAQAVNDYARAKERSTGAAALTIDWAEAVNGIAAAEQSGYQVPAVTSPNVRVQIDSLERATGDTWTATGFVELSFRPGPVASTTTAVGGPTTSAPTSPSTYAVDLTFVGEGDAMRLEDYRLDDLPYPVSQLFMAIDAPSSEAGGVTGTVTMGHRDFDGSVQYVVRAEASGTTAASTWTSAFTPAPSGSAPGTSILPVGPDSIDGTTFADPLPEGMPASVLVVFPGAFPGGPGTLTLSAGGAPATTTTTATGGSSALAWALPDFPNLTPRPVNTVDVSTSTTTSSSTTSSTTTSTTAPASSTTAPTTAVPVTPSTTRPVTTSSSAPTTTSTSTTTSTTAP